ncbi:MAG: LD-carboxypeptidase [Ferruginibacter sp.]|nr:LD-carboxypeptidase [Ferruginibacter sp.]
MNRKFFLNAIVPLFTGIPLLGRGENPVTEDEGALPAKIPPYLLKNDMIGITCPAGYITFEEIQPAINKIQEWGFQVKLGSTIGKRDFTFGGTDEERLADMQQMLDDTAVKAIMCARGGYGAIRIIDKLNFKKFVFRPKWLIGFSDITVMHSHISSNYNIGGIHSKMCNSFPADWNLAEQVQRDSIESIRQCLVGEKMKYTVLPNANNKPGSCSGKLTGGNLKTIESLAGSNSSIKTKNKILFLEDTGEYLYSIDRMFWNLKRSGKLSELKGLVIGGFKIKQDDEGEAFGKSLEEIILEKVQEYNYPVCFDFPVGHQKNNMALKCGVLHSLVVSGEIVSLSEV